MPSFGDSGTRQLRLLRRKMDTDASQGSVDQEQPDTQDSQPNKRVKSDVEPLPASLKSQTYRTPHCRKTREYDANVGFLLTPKVKEEDVKPDVLKRLLKSRLSMGFDDPSFSSTMPPPGARAEPLVELTMQDLGVYTSIAVNTCVRTPLKLLAHLSRGAQSIPLTLIDCVMEHCIADKAEKYRKLLEQQKWIEKILETFRGHAGGGQRKAWIAGMDDLSRKLRQGSVESFYIVAHNMTFHVHREHAIADPTSASFRSKLEQWNVPFDRTGLDSICVKNDEDDRLLLEHVNQVHRAGMSPYGAVVFSDVMRPGIEQMKPLKFYGARAILGLLDFIRQYYLDMHEIPRLIAATNFSFATPECYRVEKLSSLENERYLIHLEGSFFPQQIRTLCDMLEPYGDYSIGLNGGVKGSRELASTISFEQGTRTIT